MLNDNTRTPRTKVGDYFERDCVRWFSKHYDMVFHHGLTAVKHDIGIDLIAVKHQEKSDTILLIQCKWSSKNSSIGEKVYDKVIKGLNFLLENAIFYDPKKTKIELVLAAKYGIADKTTFTDPFLAYGKSADNIATAMVFFEYEKGTNELKYKEHYPKNDSFSLHTLINSEKNLDKNN